MVQLSMEYLSSICEIKTLDNELVSTGVISAITPESLDISCRTGISIFVGYGTEVKVSIFNNKLGFRILVGKIYLYDETFLRIVDLVNILDYERRHFFRVETEMMGEILPELPPSSGVGQEKGDSEAEEPETTPVRIQNLSLGGCLVISDLELKKGDQFHIKIDLLGTVGIFPCEVRRVLAGEDGMWRYGCSFGKYPRRMENILCTCIFQLQREYINKKKYEE